MEAVNKNDAMELVSSAELVDLFSEYYESDKKDMEGVHASVR